MHSDPFSHRSPRNWLQISVTGPEDDLETVGVFLANFTGNGVEYLSPPVQDGEADKTTVIGYLEIDGEIDENREQLAAFFKNFAPSDDTLTVEYGTVTEEDWGENWKKNFTPFLATKHIVIKPSWAYYTQTGGEIIVEIDPGMAFGTGHHASTCLALELTDNYFDKTAKEKQSILDVGTGTGILAITCCLLGKCRVLATDNDPDAIAIAQKNAELNGVIDDMEITDTPLSSLEGPYDLIIANIIHDVLIDMAPQLFRLLRKEGELILSGILQGKQGDEILNTFGDYGLKPLEMPVKDEWQAFRLIKE